MWSWPWPQWPDLDPPIPVTSKRLPSSCPTAVCVNAARAGTGDLIGLFSEECDLCILRLSWPTLATVTRYHGRGSLDATDISLFSPGGQHPGPRLQQFQCVGKLLPGPFPGTSGGRSGEEARWGLLHKTANPSLQGSTLAAPTPPQGPSSEDCQRGG